MPPRRRGQHPRPSCVALNEDDALVVERGACGRSAPRHYADPISVRQQPIDDVPTNEPGAADHQDLIIAVRPHWRRSRAACREGTRRPLAYVDQRRTERAVGLGQGVAVKRLMKSADARPHAFRERIPLCSEAQRGQTEFNRVAQRSPADGGGGCHARKGVIDRLQPTGTPVSEKSIADYIRNGDAVVTDSNDFPEWKAFTNRELKLSLRPHAPQGQRETRVKGGPGRKLDFRPRHGRYFFCLPGQDHNLRERVHGLLKENIDGIFEHPMIKLPGRDLSKWNIVQTLN